MAESDAARREAGEQCVAGLAAAMSQLAGSKLALAAAKHKDEGSVGEEAAAELRQQRASERRSFCGWRTAEFLQRSGGAPAGGRPAGLRRRAG